MTLTNYLKYYFKAKTKYQIHSPFVFDLVENVLEDTRYYYYFDAIEHYRKTLNQSAATIKDRETGTTISIKQIAQKKIVSEKIGQFLFRLVNHYQPKNGLEIGTSLGLTTLYQGTPSKSFSLTSFEANAALAQFTQQQLIKMGLTQVVIHSGVTNKQVLKKIGSLTQLDYVLLNELVPITTIDLMLQKCTTNAVLIINKPYSTIVKTDHWQWLKQNATIPLTIDLYDLGIAFPKAEQKQKTHFNLIKYIKKPWAMFW